LNFTRPFFGSALPVLACTRVVHWAGTRTADVRSGAAAYDRSTGFARGKAYFSASLSICGFSPGSTASICFARSSFSRAIAIDTLPDRSCPATGVTAQRPACLRALSKPALGPHRKAVSISPLASAANTSSASR
jgi:hypothetical protein